MYEEFKIDCVNNEINLPNFFSDLAYHLDRSIQYFGFYNKEIHVLSEMNKNIACSIEKAKKEINYCPVTDLYEGTFLSIQSIIKEF